MNRIGTEKSVHHNELKPYEGGNTSSWIDLEIQKTVFSAQTIRIDINIYTPENTAGFCILLYQKGETNISRAIINKLIIGGGNADQGRRSHENIIFAAVLNSVNREGKR